ncbi:MAG: DNA polymerase III subunit delta', partial [Alphaproteobacteria bacterium]|nr:DNA polymerase III subunit delta' [Alphaproteobacteria bacterium]
MADVPHPREVFELEGQEGSEAAFEAARARGRLHHAWLLTGPEGAGKATFAYRAARRLLGAPPAAAFGVLGADPEHPVCRQVAARAHPDLLVLERMGEDGKPRKVIPVDDARRLSEF